MLSFKTGIELLNSIDVKYYPPILDRLFRSLRDRAADDANTAAASNALFSPAEAAQLSTVLSMPAASLSTCLSLLLYICETALYHSLSPSRLQSALSSPAITPALSSPLLSLLSTHYAQHRDALLLRLSQQSFGSPLLISDFSWRLHVGVEGDPSRHKQARVIAAISMKTAAAAAASTASPPSPSSSPAADDVLLLEMGRAELESLYESLETIQHQLDALTEKQ
jgi:hypothetical protein